MNIKGKFDVKLTPLDSSAPGEDGIRLGRMAIEKFYHGELTGTSRGEMFSAMTSSEGSAGYVALEQVTGSLGGKSGSFVLQHYGVMNQGEERLLLEVVPGSGTGELTGLKGSMQIIIENEDHYYIFDFQHQENEF